MEPDLNMYYLSCGAAGYVVGKEKEGNRVSVFVGDMESNLKMYGKRKQVTRFLYLWAISSPNLKMYHVVQQDMW
jgi:hypothetical protein